MRSDDSQGMPLRRQGHMPDTVATSARRSLARILGMKVMPVCDSIHSTDVMYDSK